MAPPLRVPPLVVNDYLICIDNLMESCKHHQQASTSKKKGIYIRQKTELQFFFSSRLQEAV